MMKRVYVAAALVAAGLLLTADAGWAQSTGAVRGRVVDEKGSPLPEALVNLDFQGGVTRKFDTKTNKKGEFTQVGLVPGGYRITANKDGYVGTYVDTRVGLGEPMQPSRLKLTTQGRGPGGGGRPSREGHAAMREMFAKGEPTPATKASPTSAERRLQRGPGQEPARSRRRYHQHRVPGLGQQKDLGRGGGRLPQGAGAVPATTRLISAWLASTRRGEGGRGLRST